MGARKKTGGRKKGTPNKITLSMVERLEASGVDAVKGISDCLHELDALAEEENDEGKKVLSAFGRMNLITQKANIYLDLIQYLYPKRKAVEVTEDTNEVVETKVTVYRTQWGSNHESQDPRPGSDEDS